MAKKYAIVQLTDGKKVLVEAPDKYITEGGQVFISQPDEGIFKRVKLLKVVNPYSTEANDVINILFGDTEVDRIIGECFEEEYNG